MANSTTFSHLEMDDGPKVIDNGHKVVESMSRPTGTFLSYFTDNPRSKEIP